MISDSGNRKARLSRPFRSMLFVPGHKAGWADKAVASGADAVILDLEDAVAPSQLEEARRVVRSSIDEVDARGTPCFVRVNGWGSGGALLADLTATVCPALSGVMLPKVCGPEEVAALEKLLTELEAVHKLPDPLEIVPLCESARGIDARPSILTASPRVRRAPAGVFGSPNGDGSRSIGLIQTELGDETTYLLGRAVLETRAADLVGVMGGMCTNVKDLTEVERVAVRSRRFGANGALAIHPSHVPVLNQVYTPSSAEVDEAVDLVLAFREHLRGDAPDAAIVHGNRMVDIAHLRSAVDLLVDALEWRLVVPAEADEALSVVTTWLAEH